MIPKFKELMNLTTVNVNQINSDVELVGTKNAWLLTEFAVVGRNVKTTQNMSVVSTLAIFVAVNKYQIEFTFI